MDQLASDALLARLQRLHPKAIDLSLDRLQALLADFGHPELALPPVVHVAGTNGKGSVIAFMRACLEAQGYQVHVYTSPHLVRFHERIRLAGRLIDEAELSSVLDECERVNAGRPITFFEITTAAAFLAFSRATADVVLLEVGLGGRYDATNVIEAPAVTAITPVDYDHQGFLGDSLDGIAREKAGILKHGVPSVIGPQQSEAQHAIEEEAARTCAPLLIMDQDFTAFEEHGRLVYQDAAGLMDLPLPNLLGRHQIANAGVAIACLRALGRRVPALRLGEPAIDVGLTRAEWPGRLQRLKPDVPLFARLPTGSEVWLDGGHNPAAGRVLAQAMADAEERRPQPLYLVTGMLNSKDPRKFFDAFEGLARKVVTIGIPGEANTLSPAELAGAAEAAGLRATSADTIDAAIELIAAEDAAAPPRILICGSLYLAGHVLRATA